MSGRLMPAMESEFEEEDMMKWKDGQDGEDLPVEK
jgi:hypothetical protein